MNETPRERLVTLVKSLAHPYAGADMTTMEYEALALIDRLIPQRPRWSWRHRRWQPRGEE